MKLLVGVVAFILFSFSHAASMKRNIFSPFDPKDTPDTFTKEDIEDASLFTQIKTSAKSFTMPFTPFNFSSNPPSHRTKPNVQDSRTKVFRRPYSQSASPSSFDSFRKVKFPKPSAPKYSPKIPANFPGPQVQSGEVTKTSFISVASDIQPTVSKANKIGVNQLSIHDEDEPNLYFYLYPDHQDDRDYTPVASSYGHYDGYDGYEGYDTSSSHYGGGGSGFFDMHAVHTRYLFKIALPLFLLGGLLFGLSAISTQTVNFGRSDDNIPSFITGIEKKVEKYFKEYVKILESDYCTQRVLCEAGYATSDYSATKILIRFMDLFLPKEMRGDLKVFKSTALNKKNVEKCNLFKCKITKRPKEKTRDQKRQKEEHGSTETEPLVLTKSAK